MRNQLVPVVTVKAEKSDIEIRLPALGAVTPLNTVTVRTRVDGQLMSVNFIEGQPVEKDSLLALIDPAPFQAQLLQVEGQLARDKAFLANAQLDLDRYNKLLEQDSIAQQQRDTQQALVNQYTGTVQMDKGAVKSAQVQLDYTRITSPLSGRVGLRLVDPGNIVHAADANGLVVITQLNPISVIFTVPEDDLPEVLAKFNAGERLTADALDRSDNHGLAEGTLEWMDNVIDPTTGTVRLRAIFPNDKNALFAGQFVNISLLLDVKHGATVAPQAAIQIGPQGTFVYVIGPDNVATVKPVRVGPTEKTTRPLKPGCRPEISSWWKGPTGSAKGRKSSCPAPKARTVRVLPGRNSRRLPANPERAQARPSPPPRRRTNPRPSQEQAIESFPHLHPPARGDDPADGRHPPRRRRRLPPVARLRPAGGRLPDDPGEDLLSRRAPRTSWPRPSPRPSSASSA